jgi:hypothetical protein
VLHIIHDGPASKDIEAVLGLYNDPRILYQETPTVNGFWGHINRRLGLSQLVLNHRDYVLMTNDDNYYVPIFVEKMLKKSQGTAGMVYCDTVHSYYGYNILKTQVKENQIDMGSFIVRVDVAKKARFTDTHLSADGTYAERCAAYARGRRFPVVYVPLPLFVHN